MHIYTEAEIRQADKEASIHGLSENALMETAGRSLFQRIVTLVSKQDRILILAGRGNNGGDAIVLARYFLQNGYNAELVFPFGLPKSKTAKEHFSYYKSLGFSYCEKVHTDEKYDVIIDGLLGVGVKLPLSDNYLELLRYCNNEKSLRISIDLPTGVQADSGKTDYAFHAHYTFSLHGFKPSAFLLPAAKYYGKKDVLDIGLVHRSKWRIWSKEDVKGTLGRRDRFSHKGTFGTGLLIAGSDDMPGSMLLAAMGAMHLGVGKLIIGTTKFAASIACSNLPEATYWFNGLEKCANGEFPEDIRACAIGPGISNKSLVEKAVNHLMERDIPLVLDAGALFDRKYSKRAAPLVITPHPGEFARILGMSTEKVQQERISLASSYAQEHQIIVVLKGADTVIAYPDGTGVINPTGNSGLAKGGSGDTLTGMLLAMLSTEKDAYSAVANAVYIHGMCADELVKVQDERSISASQIANIIGTVLRKNILI